MEPERAHLSLTIAELMADFPRFQVAFLAARGLAPSPAPAIEAFCREAEAAAAAHLAGHEIADLEEIRDWRATYRAFGSKKTSYRNSCEALLRRLKAGQGLPRVLSLVDLYNAISVMYLVPAGADDLDQVTPPNAFRFARPGDSFLDLARDPPVDDPPFEGEVVYTDSEKCLCRRWNWRQDARSRIRPETRDTLVVIQTLADDGEARLSAAAERFAQLAGQDLGATCHWSIANAAMPHVTLPTPD
ncbi:MAG: phenylalanine--tRNA ligase beta subunit-related protein [Pseudomonadota bacterium]